MQDDATEDDRRTLGRAAGVSARGVDDRAAQTPTHPLSVEERRILALLAAGLTFGQVARRAGLSERTVRRRVENAGRILGTQTTIEAVVVAVRCRLL
ncbi:helix-turn-helix transcriptional regulator [Microbacter sp. GSS18]|nr:helix-turn-helix transcriptional regulator [Microbacter sp. GSS18]